MLPVLEGQALWYIEGVFYDQLIVVLNTSNLPKKKSCLIRSSPGYDLDLWLNPVKPKGIL